MTRKEARILISHATATWLGLMKVLCPIKVPEIKRQVASISKKAKEPSDQNNNNFLSGPKHPPKVKYMTSTPQHSPKVKYTQTVAVKQQQDERPTLKQHSQGRKCHRGKPAHMKVDGHLDHQPVKSHSFQVDGRKATSLGGRQSMSPTWITTPSQSKIKSTSKNHYCSSTFKTTTPSQSEILGFLPKHLCYQPQEDQETYYINSEGHLQCHQDPQNIIKASTPRSFPGQRSTLSFTNLAQLRSVHKPGSIKVSSVGDLLKLYPNSFDRLGSLKREYGIKVDLQCHQYSMQGGRCQ